MGKAEEGVTDKHLIRRDCFHYGVLMHEELAADLRNVYDEARTLYEEIHNTQEWKGKAKQRMESFLHLVLQFHGVLIQAEGIADSDYNLEHNFIKEAGQAFEQAMRGMDTLQEEELLRRLDEITCL